MEQLQSVKSMALCMQRYPWEQGVLAQAFLESGDKDITIRLAREAAHRAFADGRAAMMEGTDPVTDPMSCGEPLLYAYDQTGDTVFKDALEGMRRWTFETAPRYSDGTLYHVTQRPEFWSDSFYMLPPYLAATGEFEEAVRQLDGYWNALFLEDKGLLGHIRNMETGQWVRRACWGGGNGWALAGMARVISSLPEHMNDAKKRLIGRVEQLIGGALPLMRDDGLFYDVLDDPSTFVEVNFPQMLAYTICRGIAERWLPETYRPHADKMRQAAHAKVDVYGQVCDVCGAPHFQTAGMSTEGQAFYIMMETAYHRLPPSA